MKRPQYRGNVAATSVIIIPMIVATLMLIMRDAIIQNGECSIITIARNSCPADGNSVPAVF